MCVIQKIKGHLGLQRIFDLHKFNQNQQLVWTVVRSITDIDNTKNRFLKLIKMAILI